MRRQFARFLDLPGSDKLLLTKAWFYLLEAGVLLRIAPFPRVQRWAKLGAREHSSGESVDKELLRRVQRVVRIAARNHLVEMLCLPRSLVLQKLLSERGLETELKIGVRRDGDSLSAHAWLEWNGDPLGEPENISARFAPFAGLNP